MLMSVPLINNGGLIVASYGVLQVLRYAEKIFKLRVKSEKRMRLALNNISSET